MQIHLLNQFILPNFFEAESQNYWDAKKEQLAAYPHIVLELFAPTTASAIHIIILSAQASLCRFHHLNGTSNAVDVQLFS